MQKQNSCNCNTWEAECELRECRRVIISCCFTQQQVLEVNCHPAREKEAALGDIRNHVGRFQEAHMVLPVLLSVFSMHVLTVTFPGPVMPSFNPFVLTQVLGSHLSAQALGKPRCLDHHCWVPPSWSSQVGTGGNCPPHTSQHVPKKCIQFLWSAWRTGRKFCFYVRAPRHPGDRGAIWEWMAWGAAVGVCCDAGHTGFIWSPSTCYRHKATSLGVKAV